MSVLNSGVNTTLQQTTYLLSLLAQTLGNRAGLLADPVLAAAFMGDMAGARATAGARPRSNLGALALVSETEGTGVSITNPTFARDTVTIAGYRRAFGDSDLFRTLQMGHPGGQDALALGLIQAAGLTLADVVAALAAGYSTVEGTTGTSLTLTDWLSAQGRLAAANADGRTLGVVHSRQATQLRLDALLVSGGQVGNSPDANQRPMDGLNSGSYRADFFGSGLLVSNSVADSGGDRIGMMVGAQGLTWACATPEAGHRDDVVLPPLIQLGAPVFPGALLRRVAATGTGIVSTEVVSFLGAAEAQDLAGTRLLSVDA